MGETAVNWAIACWWCKKSFMSSEADHTTDGFIKCPSCLGWSGFEMRKKRPSMEPTGIVDPGQDRLIRDMWAWVVVDPSTQLEGVCGILVDGCPRMAISSSRDEALRMCELIRTAKANTNKKFRLVRYEKTDMEMEL